jgi:hypothetical protein
VISSEVMLPFDVGYPAGPACVERQDFGSFLTVAKVSSSELVITSRKQIDDGASEDEQSDSHRASSPSA